VPGKAAHFGQKTPSRSSRGWRMCWCCTCCWACTIVVLVAIIVTFVLLAGGGPGAAEDDSVFSVDSSGGEKKDKDAAVADLLNRLRENGTGVSQGHSNAMSGFNSSNWSGAGNSSNASPIDVPTEPYKMSNETCWTVGVGVYMQFIMVFYGPESASRQSLSCLASERICLGSSNACRDDSVKPCALFNCNLETKGDVIVRVTNVRSRDGLVRVGMARTSKEWDRAEVNWRSESLIQNSREAPKDGCKSCPAMDFIFRDMLYGVYAAVVLHDRDRDGRLDKNWIGMPKEGLGASGGSGGPLGGPKWRDAAFTFASREYIREIEIWYP